MVENEMDQLSAMGPNTKVVEYAGEEEASIDLAALYQLLRCGRRTILWVSLCFLAIATAIAFLTPARYTSVTSFVPPNLGGNSPMASAVAGQLAVLGAGDLLGGVKNSGDLYAGVLRSQSIAEDLIEKEHLMQVYKVKKMSRAEKALAEATAVSVDPKSSIVTVEVTDKSPALAQKLASDYMESAGGD